ncbi:chemotaxis protein methyltransferase [Sporosarcina sp. NCCP-2716]|uniref:CheR family methyltransferase n=1 Tax=Sporosarcina sp. NCCP-2716 TaxID=2943679 RepID=UPI00203AA05E|nr:protein-glutamate O-methyltransferase CheR [Sporosarcina sp. NCCP-2716]GKV67949.1 chemotaxis protein methyltransferase [Sporosarcina sp. NCCP-2716]
MSDYTQFIDNVKKKTGIDLSLYKEAQMKRRLTSLYEKRKCRDFTEYFELIRSDRSMMDEFLDRMTINVSEFYRNGQRWEVLDKKIIPQLLKQSKTLKCWSAACSTGEEPYSMSMVLSNHMPLREVSILATDLDQGVIEKAKVGLYPDRSLKEVPADVKKKYFTQEGQFYQVKEEVKRSVTFKKHNLLEDSYGSGFDLIVCRNVMIYFTEEAKDQIYSNFAKALKPGGILFVGSTEQIFSPDRYGLESEDTFFYKKL